MIKNKKDLKEYIKADIQPFDYKKKRLLAFYAFITKDLYYYRIKYLKTLRKLEYILNVHPKRIISRIYLKTKKNIIGNRFGWEIPSNVCGPGLHIWHANVVVNDDAHIGSNCVFHGNNCVGRKGNGYPNIGDNFDLGFGSVVVGNIKIGNNYLVGANSFVNKNFENDEGGVLVGSPAKLIKK